MIISRRWLSGIPFVLALVVLLFLAWCALISLGYPYDGILSISATGTIKVINLNGPAYQILQENDVILLIDGIPQVDAHPYYPNKRPGDIVTYTIQREGTKESVSIRLAQPNLEEIVTRLAPLLVAFIFLAIGVGVQAYQPASEGANVYFLFFLTTALFLISGVFSDAGPAWVYDLYNVLFWLLGPLSLHFHLYFPQNTNIPRQNILLTGLYILAILAALPFLLYSPEVIRTSVWFSSLIFASRIFLVLNLLIVIGLLFYAYRHAMTPGVRSKIRIVVLGGALSLLPVVTLFILPDTLFQQTLIPYSFLFLFLGIMPLTYGYAIFRHRLIEIERHVNRGATFILVYSILGSLYLLMYVPLEGLVPENIFSAAVINTVIVLLLASVFVPLRQSIQRLVDSVFYGGWYDYRSAVPQITQGLDQITELQTLAKTTSKRLVKTLRLDEAVVFIADVEGDYSVVEVAPQPSEKEGPGVSYLPLPRTSLSYLLNMGEAVERTALRRALAEVTLSPEEHELLNSEQVHLWVPIIGHEQVLGLLALGPKFGGDIFSSEDIDILRIVARQMGPVIENIHLVSRLRRYAAELEQRVEERTEELSASKKRVEAIFASVGEGVIVTDLDWTFLTVNAAYLAQTGYTEVELVGRSLWNFYRIDDAVEMIEDIHLALRDGEIWKSELVGVRKDHSRYDVQLTITPLRDDESIIIGYIGSQRDITQQKELDRLKDLFVSDVSHELRTPTTNIGLYVELMETAPPEKHPAYLKVLQEQSQLLVKLVEDILDLSRLAIGKTRRIELQEIDLNTIVDQVVTAHMPLADAAGLSLTYQLDPELQSLRGEPNQLARLVNNLVTNAIHYTPVGKVVVRTFSDEGWVCLEVSDTGFGIDPEDKPHLFERFYRGRRVRQSKIHGTGLGLAIVKEIIDLHDGMIEIDSEVNKGSTFVIRFPELVSEQWLEKQS